MKWFSKCDFYNEIFYSLVIVTYDCDTDLFDISSIEYIVL